MESRNRLEIRQSVGYNLGAGQDPVLIVSNASANATAVNTITDSYGLRRGGDSNEYNGGQIMPTSGGNLNLKRWVTTYDNTNTKLTITPNFSVNININDGYELWRRYTIEQVNDAINQAIIGVSDDCPQLKQIATAFTEWDKYEYNCLTNFVAVSSVEFVSKIREGETLHDCDVAWDGATGVTVTLDDEKKRRGSYSNKLTVTAGVVAGALLATATIPSADLSNYDTIELWIESTIDIAASTLLLVVDDTADCASPIESIAFPALTANTPVRVQLTMVYPRLDTAIISIGLKQEAATGLGACVIWIDYVTALKAVSRVFTTLNPVYWDIVRGTTNYLKLTPDGKAVTGNDTLLRITGYDTPALLSDDTTDSEIDPDYLIAATTGKVSKDTYWNALAQDKKLGISVSYLPGTRVI